MQIRLKEHTMIEWFDDLALGMRFESGNVQITENGIKGLAASGWHTAAIAMNLAVQVRPFGPHPLIGMGVDELRWMAPVRPGDTLHLEGEVTGLTPSRTKPQGIALVKWTVFNQNGEAVYTFTPIAIVPRRPPST
jgi:acyl dehydratase